MSRVFWLRLIPVVLVYSFLIWDSKYLATKIFAFLLFLISTGIVFRASRKQKIA